MIYLVQKRASSQRQWDPYENIVIIDDGRGSKHVAFSLPVAKFTCIILSLSHTEHGWAHGSSTVYSIIHGLTGTSI